MTAGQVLRIAAFADGEDGGNPAGVWLGDALPADADMQRIAAEIGYSETAFAMPQANGWRVRYFAPECEVPFCGHATIALGTALARQFGDGLFALRLNRADIEVEGRWAGGRAGAVLRSPPTRSRPAPAARVAEALALFGYGRDDLDERLPPALIHGGADHLMLALHSRAALASMAYELDAGRALMRSMGLATVMLVHAETARRFHARNPFAAGGIYEDPATGAAAASFGGYLRDLGWPHDGAIDVVQGEDMGQRSLLHVEIPPAPGRTVRVSGFARIMR